MLKFWVWKCHQAAHLQTSNVPFWWEYSEKGHQVEAMQLFCTMLYKHPHTKDPKPLWFDPASLESNKNSATSIKEGVCGGGGGCY